MSFSRGARYSRFARRDPVLAIHFLLLGVLTAATARSQAEAEKAVKSLSVPTRTTGEELSSPVSLPADDASWQAVKKDTHAPTDAVWYRRWIAIPIILNG